MKRRDGYTFTDLTAHDFRNCALAGERGRLPRFEQRLSNGLSLCRISRCGRARRELHLDCMW